jgi:LacI family transcriptional regulator
MVIVTIDRRPKNLILDQVTVNNSDGACSAVRHLAEQGHTQIGFIYGLPKISTSSERLNGFRLAVQSHGLYVDPSGSKKATFAGKMASNEISYG